MLAPILTLALLASLVGNLWLARRAVGYFARAEQVQLDPLGLVGAPFPTPPAAPAGVRTVVFFGDSRAEGWPAPGGLGGYRFVNRGIGGQTSAQVAGRFAAHVAPLAPDVLVLQVGINDLKAIPFMPERRAQIVAGCVANIAAIVGEARALGATVILTTVIPPGALSWSRWLSWSPEIDTAITEVNAALGALAGEGVILLDTAGPLGVAGGRIDPAFRYDSLHLNEAGYAALNAALGEALGAGLGAGLAASDF